MVLLFSGILQLFNGFDIVMCVDMDFGQVEQYCFGYCMLVEEYVFVLVLVSVCEGEGWLIGMVFDVDVGCMRLMVFDV